MTTKLENTIDAVETAMLDVYARTNRDAGVLSCTVASGWTTSAGNVSAITFTADDTGTTKTRTYRADRLIGRHLLRSSVARRITDSGATDDTTGITALTTEAFTTAPTAGAGEIRDGFVKCDDDVLLLDDQQDRHFQVVVDPPVRDQSFGVKGTARFNVRFDITVLYEYGHDRRRDRMRADEDAQAIVNIMLDDAYQPSGGVVLFPDGEPETIEPETEGGEESPVFVLVIPMSATYTAGSLED